MMSLRERVQRARERLGMACMGLGVWLLGINPEKLDLDGNPGFGVEPPEESVVKLSPHVGLSAKAQGMVEQGSAPAQEKVREDTEAPLRGSLEARLAEERRAR
jgi:hypothetical protein